MLLLYPTDSPSAPDDKETPIQQFHILIHFLQLSTSNDYVYV